MNRSTLERAATNPDSARMFVPAQYVAADPRSLIQRYPFATLVTASAAGLHATCLPFVFETDHSDEVRLIGHMAARNSHAAALGSQTPALAVFLGPHAYISSRWYKDKPEVPTWNYVAAQVRGSLQVFNSPRERLAVLTRTVEVMERDNETPWTLAHAPPGMVDRLLDLICAFRLTIEQLEGATKLNQSHPESDRLRVIRGLVESGTSGNLLVAELMAHLPPDRVSF